MPVSKFTYVDLFAGIGGFHAALEALGGQCVYASEIDEAASSVYELNWGINPRGDITEDANADVMNVPEHDVLVGGFPCQPFSKSGAQRGMDETRGTLYWNILKIIQARTPTLILLENVRNLVGPRHRHEWDTIIRSLRESGYRVSEHPWILSPHRIPRELGGRPHARDRVFIVAVRTSGEDKSVDKLCTPTRVVEGWNSTDWNLIHDLPLEKHLRSPSLKLTEQQQHWLSAWDDFVRQMSLRTQGGRLPGFPLWGDEWGEIDETLLDVELPTWKRNFLIKNSIFYVENKDLIDSWADKWGFYTDNFPPSRRKFEWQAGSLRSLKSTIIHMRPSGIRVKRADYVPALVAITQTSFVYDKSRFLSVREAARLQGLPDWFDFGGQPDRLSYKQLGNGVSVGAIWYALKHSLKVFESELKAASPGLYRAIKEAPCNPDAVLVSMRHK